jgi:uncharacterized heparinase superfamily protein
LETAGRVLHRYGQHEWFGSPFHLRGLKGPKPAGPGAAPRNLRPVSAQRGEALLSGVFSFAGETLNLGPGGEPFDRPNPSRAFAEELHRFEWLGDLLALGERGERDALRLTLEWRRVFGGWNSFSWSDMILERRAFHLACALRALSSRASDLEAQQLAESLARQGRQLLKINHGPVRAAERACVAGIAGTALAGDAGDRLIGKALDRLSATLEQTVLPDGGHASRSPEAILNLFLDLMTLDDGLSQRAVPAPAAVSRAIDRMGRALRFLTLPDGRLACFQGGEAARPGDVAAALAAAPEPAAAKPLTHLAHTGYQRLAGRTLTVMADAAAPAQGAWSETACAQPLAFELLVGKDRLVTNCGWSPRAQGPQSLRMASAASTMSLGEAPPGEPEGHRFTRVTGARLRGGARKVTASRQENAEGVWLELSHDAWQETAGLRHERLLFLDRKSDELRGEDRLMPTGGGQGRPAPATVRFHLHPGVKASVALDRKSVLLHGEAGPGWWLRNDAQEVSIEHSVHYEEGQPRRALQVVLRSEFPASGGKMRWKIARAKPDES